MNAPLKQAEEIIIAPRAKIARSRFQKPHVGKRGNLESLAKSLEELGQLVPVIVRPAPSDLKGVDYELVDGERRYNASGIAKLESLHIIVRDYTDEQVLDAQLTANIGREDLHPLDEAELYEQRVKLGQTVQHIADTTGKDVAHVAKRMQLCRLCKGAREAYGDDRITLSTAQAIARIPSERLQLECLKLVTAKLDASFASDGAEAPPVTITARAIEKLVRERFMLRLATAPFDRSDSELVKKAGACITCPKRTGNQPELFDDVDSPDLCIDGDCFRSKLEAHGEKQLAAAKQSGGEVLTDAQAKKVFDKHAEEGALAFDSGFVDLDEEQYVDGKKVKPRKLLGDKAAAKTTLAKNPYTGRVHELVPESALRTAKRAGNKTSAGGSKTKKGASSPSSHGPSKAELEKRERATKRFALIATRTIAAIVAATEKAGAAGTALALDVLLEQQIKSTSPAELDDACKARGLEPGTKSGGAGWWSKYDVLAVYARKRANGVAALLIELVLGENLSFEYEKELVERICKTLKIDRKAIDKSVDAELAAATKAKEAPAAAAKTTPATSKAKAKPKSAAKPKAKAAKKSKPAKAAKKRRG